MSFSHADWEKYNAGQARQEVQKRQHELRWAEQAEIAANLLMEDSHWNSFLQILQGEAEFCKARQADLQAQVCEPGTIGDQIQKLRMEALRLKTIHETLEHVIKLPSQLKERGEKAREILRTYAEN